ncbi:MAG: hypothetical protein ACK41E_00695 [Deinococcales bacterium]
MNSRVALIVALSVALVACPSGSVTPPPNTSPFLGLNPTITGTLVGYTGAAGKIEVRAAPFFADAGTIAANGTFSVTLPSSGFGLFNLSEIGNCNTGTGTISILPNNAKYNYFEARLPNGGYLSQSDNIKSGAGQVSIQRFRWFVDKDVVINGSCTIGTSGSKGVFSYNNLSLKNGWNEITAQYTGNNTNGWDVVYSLGIASNQPWGQPSGEYF